jgi:hypothetical protein
MSSDKAGMLSSTERNTEVRIIELEVENSRLQILIAELLLKNQKLRDGRVPVSKSAGPFN